MPRPRCPGAPLLLRPRPRLGLALALALGVLLQACASIPPDRFGVNRIRFRGVEQMDEYALRACLATAERSRFALNVGTTTEPSCNAPPFDGRRVRLPAWPWSWSEFPVYDRSVFERDLRRIERWYQARGYYGARVLSTRFSPDVAASTSTLPLPDDAAERDEGGDDEENGAPDPSTNEPGGVDDDAGGPPEEDAPVCERRADDEGCELEIDIAVEEGEPVLVRSLDIAGVDGLDEDLVDALRRSWRLETGERFDETFYNQSRTAMRRVLGERGYACGVLVGDVAINREERWADITVTVTPGPRPPSERSGCRGTRTSANASSWPRPRSIPG